ncbi:MAG TPA: Sir2 family NAD-dependent protein deacetylase [Acidimicrobiia bacterium]|nr:Sir2 family NAD-dependent protein deacetylase [Acidimicrobiia bacterium]
MSRNDDIGLAIEILRPASRILVFTGAGISTESGIPDFRGPDGLWTKVDPEDFHIDRFRASAELRMKGWKMHLDGELWGARSTVRPNSGHQAIKRLADGGRLAGVVTQNVDGLHHESGLDDDMVAELHGNVRGSHCVDCGSTWATEDVLTRVEAGELDPDCPDCGGMVKTATVMFGELLPEREMGKAMQFLAMSDALLVLGSTVAVWPASDVVMRGALRSLPIVVVNRGATEADMLASVKLDAAIGDVLPDIVDGLLAPKRR